MDVSKITAIFFSPAGGTQNVVRALASALPLPVEELDITSFSKHQEAHTFASDELVIFAVPVYAGRIVPLAAERFARMKGRQTPAVCVAVYGNRAYEDALLELTDLAQQNGFVPFAAAAALAEHSIMRSVAHGRPDKQDAQKLASFAQQLWQKLEQAPEGSSLAVPAVPGNRPYKAFKAVGFVPSVSSACTRCGRCAARCPSGAISPACPDKTDKTRCIFCMGCVSVCPVQARHINKALLWAAEKAFALKFGERKEPAFFL